MAPSDDRDAAGEILRVDEVTHEWLERCLGWRLGGHEPITAGSISQSGGLMGNVHRVSCAGRSFIFKGPPDSASAWGALALDTDVVAREVQAYRFLQEHSHPKVSPDCYWSTLTADGRGALALEDLGPQSAPAGLMAAGLDYGQARAVVECLATVHAASSSTTADPLAPPRPWLYTAASDGLLAAIRLGLEDLPTTAAPWLPAEDVQRALERLEAVDVEAVVRGSHAGADCSSLCHGDAWANNVLFAVTGDAAPRAFLIDWQFAMWGNPLSDVALLLMSSLTVESRREWQDALLAHYHATLTAHRPLEYSLAACRRDFRTAEPFAALVALATLEGYTSGMDPEDLARFAARASAFADPLAAPAESGT